MTILSDTAARRLMVRGLVAIILVTLGAVGIVAWSCHAAWR